MIFCYRPHPKAVYKGYVRLGRRSYIVTRASPGYKDSSFSRRGDFRMKNMARYAVLPLFLTITGCATQGSMDIIRNDIDTIKTRLFSMEKDLGGVREYSREGLESVEK